MPANHDAGLEDVIDLPGDAALAASRGEGYGPPAVTLRIPVGVSNFRMLREQGLAYVDKSHLLRELLDKGTQCILLPRPRRFGKTLALSMLLCFFEKRDADLSGLFADLSIWQAGDEYRLTSSATRSSS